MVRARAVCFQLESSTAPVVGEVVETISLTGYDFAGSGDSPSNQDASTDACSDASGLLSAGISTLPAAGAVVETISLTGYDFAASGDSSVGHEASTDACSDASGLLSDGISHIASGWRSRGDQFTHRILVSLVRLILQAAVIPRSALVQG